MPKTKRDHSSSRSMVCLICRYKIFKNGSILKDNTRLTLIIQENYELFHNFDPNDMTFPNAVCSTCTRALNRFSNSNNKEDLPHLKVCAYSSSNITPAAATHTRSCSNASPCDICQIAGQRNNPSSRDVCKCPKCNNNSIHQNTAENVSDPSIPFKFTASNLLKIQAEQNASNNQMIKLAKSIRSICGRKSVEPRFKEKLRDLSKKAEDFYSFALLPFQINEKLGSEERVLVYCHDIESFIDYILKDRKYDPHSHIVRIGLDGGGGMFKIIMNIIDTAGCQPSCSFQDTGVRKTIFIAAVEKIKETYANIKSILSKIQNLDKIKFFICSDIKLINIICGIQSCSAKHPCPYCVTDNLCDFDTKFGFRTLGSISCSATAYNDAGSMSKNAKLYTNCIYEPLFPVDADERILDVCAPPELHLMQGIVKHIYDKAYAEWSDISLWLKHLNINQKNYHHGSFVGNDCIKMLKHIDVLQQIAPLYIQKYVHIFKCLHSIVISCFGMELDSEFKKHIIEFKELYATLDISVTPKVHILIEHVPDFILKQGRSLGWFSEQALESSHYDFLNNCWEKQGYKRAIGHPDYAKNLMAAVTAYSSKHIL